MDPDEIPRAFKATNEFDQLIDAIDADPDLVHEVARDGKPAAVLISPALFDRLKAVDGGRLEEVR